MVLRAGGAYVGVVLRGGTRETRGALGTTVVSLRAGESASLGAAWASGERVGGATVVSGERVDAALTSGERVAAFAVETPTAGAAPLVDTVRRRPWAAEGMWCACRRGD